MSTATVTADTKKPLKLPFTRGNIESKILIIGEAPGADEAFAYRHGKRDTAFVGRSGKLLDLMLSNASIKDAYFTNVVKRRPRDNNLKIVSREDIEKYRKVLHDEISSLPNVNVIVPVGNLALWAITPGNSCVKLQWNKKKDSRFIKNLTGIGNWRGSIIRSQEINGRHYKVIPTYHPAYVAKQYLNKPTVECDLERVREESTSPYIKLPEHNIIVRPTLQQVREFIRRCKLSPYFALDIENKPFCIGLAISKNEAICIPFAYENGKPYWSVMEEAQIMRLLHSLLTTHSGQVGQFYYHDAYWLHHLGLIEGLKRRFNNCCFDTFSAHLVLYAELSHTLQYMTSIYTRVPYYKEEGREWNKDIESIDNFWFYNGKDCVVTYEIFEHLKLELEKRKLTEFFDRHYTTLFPHLLQSMLRGTALDELTRSKAVDEYRKKWLEEQTTLQENAGKPIKLHLQAGDRRNEEWRKVDGYLNVKSWQQVKDYLRSLGCPIRSTEEKYLKKTASYNKTTDKARQAIKDILEIRSTRQVLSNFLTPKLGHDDRFHFTMKNATKSGRRASSNDPLGFGTNAQNWPDGIARQCIVADPGYVLAYIDYSQIEARIVAYLSRCQKMIDEFNSGEDTHCIYAGELFDVDYNTLYKGHKERDPAMQKIRTLGKVVRHATNYRGKPSTMSFTTGLPVNTCKTLRDKNFQKYPEILEWHHEILNTIKKTRILTNPLGRERIFFGRLNSEDTWNEAVSFTPQSTVPDLVSIAYKEIQSAGIKILIDEHDALLMQFREEDLLEGIKFAREKMNIPITIHGDTFTVPTDVEVGYNWNSEHMCNLEEWQMRAT